MASTAFGSQIASRIELSGFGRALKRLGVPSGVGVVLAVAVAYYLGAWIGFAFQSPRAPQSVLWLPNSILLAALLMNEPRRWPMLLAAGLPGHLVVAQNSGAPLLPLSLLYLTNCADAALSAGAVRLATRGRWQLTDLRSLLVFLGLGALLGPLLIGVLDAAITVLTGWGTSFRAAYSTRLIANSLTNVIVVPAIVGTLGASAIRKPRTAASVGEAMLMITSLLVVSTLIFSRPFDASAAAWIYLPLPFLLWAAVRFGAGVTGIALLAVAFVSSWTALHGSGAFSNVEPATSVVALQSLLLCISVPMLALAMVVQERGDVMLELMQSRNAIRVGVDTVRDLAGRLLANQEVERSRIARELHDGIAQYVAEMALQVSATRRLPAARAAGLDADFQRLADQTTLLFDSVRTLSHELHPSVLRHAGLVPAMRSLCEGFARQHDVVVHFDCADVDPLADDISLCVYRITQEALHNVAAHAHARRVGISLARSQDGLGLTISDDGAGFDVIAAHARRGLGLVSMEERVRLLRGRFRIESGTGQTRISVTIPAGHV
jgi:signal transduction histidine kinase